MAFYKCLPIKPQRTNFITNGNLIYGYTRTEGAMGYSKQGMGARFTPNPNGSYNTIVFSMPIPAKAKKVFFRGGAYVPNCGGIGVSTDPNAKGAGQCAKFQSLANNDGTYTMDISDINQPLYLVINCYYYVDFEYAYAE